MQSARIGHEFYIQPVSSAELKNLFKRGRKFRGRARKRIDKRRLLVQIGPHQVVAESDLPIHDGDLLPLVVTGHEPKISLKLLALDDPEWAEHSGEFVTLESSAPPFLALNLTSLQHFLASGIVYSPGSMHDKHRLYVHLVLPDLPGFDVELTHEPDRSRVLLLADSAAVLQRLRRRIGDLRGALQSAFGPGCSVGLSLKTTKGGSTQSLDVRI